MVQVVRPTSDVTNEWSSGGFGEIDETPFSDSDFAYSIDKPTDDVLEVHLGDPTDPAVNTGHIFRYRWATVDGGVLSGDGTSVTQAYVLVQGTTLITGATANQHTTNSATFSAVSVTLTGTEADAITDYTDLRLRITASGGGGSPTDRRGAACSFAEFEVPDAASSDRQAQVSAFELETTDPGTQAQVSAFELETTDPATQAQVSAFELETTDPGTQAQVSAFEFEVPGTATQCQISAFELEAPDADRRCQVSAFELETTDPGTQAQVSAFELETEDEPRQAQVSAFELEVPNAQTKCQVSAFELETTDPGTQAQVSAFELEVPNAQTRCQISAFELEVPGAPTRAQVSAFELQGPEVGGGERNPDYPVPYGVTRQVARLVTERQETP